MPGRSATAPKRLAIKVLSLLRSVRSLLCKPLQGWSRRTYGEQREREQSE
jgi:hypothetical protein